MKKLKDILYTWYSGRTYNGIKTPPLATIRELEGIYYGTQRTTINSTVISILSVCGIKYKEKGIGWEVLK